MTHELRPYPEYKDSGLPWLGEIPAHWEEKRAKYFYREVNERSQTGEEELLSVSHVTGVTPRSQKNVTMFKAESYVGSKLCHAGDLVINTMWAWMAALGVARQTGIVSPAYGVYRPRHSNAFMPDFVDHLLRTQPYASEYFCRSTGIRKSRLRLYPEKFLEIPIVCPPIEEQRQIVAYLTAKDHIIRRFIRNRRLVIELLNEQKRAITSRAVTRGIDAAVRVKASGINWLGDVPEHWEVTRIKNEFHCLNHRRVPLNSVERGTMTKHEYDYYGASGVIDKVDDYLFDDDLLLIAEDGANLVLRNLPLAIIARGKFWVNNHAHILKPKRGNIEYLAGFLETLNYRPWITGAAQPKLTQDRLMSISICVASPEEQGDIVAHIDEATAPLRTAIVRAEREIGLLREHRTRLTADVVTGKVDVRHLALEALTPSPEDLEPLDNGEVLDDELQEDEDLEAVEEVADAD